MERLYREGHSLNQVADQTCTTLGQVHYILKKRGVPMRAKNKKARKPDGKDCTGGRPIAGPPPWLDDAVGMYEHGMSLVAIGDAVGSSGMTVRRHLTRAGVKMRPAKGRGRPKNTQATTDEAAPPRDDKPITPRAARRAQRPLTENCPTCRGTGSTHPGVKRPGYGWMPIWMMYPNGEGWAL